MSPETQALLEVARRMVAWKPQPEGASVTYSDDYPDDPSLAELRDLLAVAETADRIDSWPALVTHEGAPTAPEVTASPTPNAGRKPRERAPYVPAKEPSELAKADAARRLRRLGLVPMKRTS